MTNVTAGAGDETEVLACGLRGAALVHAGRGLAGGAAASDEESAMGAGSVQRQGAGLGAVTRQCAMAAAAATATAQQRVRASDEGEQASRRRRRSQGPGRRRRRQQAGGEKGARIQQAAGPTSVFAWSRGDWVMHRPNANAPEKDQSADGGSGEFAVHERTGQRAAR